MENWFQPVARLFQDGGDGAADLIPDGRGGAADLVQDGGAIRRR